MKFIINNDLDDIKLDFHNKFHLFGAIAMVLFGVIFTTLFRSATYTYLFWLIWEILDGIKPHWTTYKNRNGGNWLDFIRKEMLYSNYFSAQDILVWDSLGVIIGIIIVLLLR